MKKNELPEFIKGMKTCGNLTAKIGVAVGKSRRRAEQEIKEDEEDRPRPNGWKEYEKKEGELIKKYATGSDGRRVFFGENEKVFNTELKELQEKYKSLIEENKKMTYEWEKYLEQEAEFEIHKIKEEDIPKETTGDQYYWLTYLLEEEGKEPKKKSEQAK